MTPSSARSRERYEHALTRHPNADGGQNVVCMQDGQAKGAVENDLSTTLNASHE